MKQQTDITIISLINISNKFLNWCKENEVSFWLIRVSPFYMIKLYGALKNLRHFGVNIMMQLNAMYAVFKLQEARKHLYCQLLLYIKTNCKTHVNTTFIPYNTLTCIVFNPFVFFCKFAILKGFHQMQLHSSIHSRLNLFRYVCM